MELISILIPTYNIEKFIKEAIISILQQTYKKFEVIIVDDASTDDTYAILKELASGDNRIKLYQNNRNKKIADTLNYALSVSQGSYILRMDGDDISMPDRLEKLYCFLIENPRFNLVGSHTITIDESGKEIGKSRFPINEESVYKGLKYKMSPVAHIWLAKREVYTLLKAYRFPPVEDYDFLLRARTSNIRFVNLDEFLYKVRIRRGNTASTSGLLQRLAADHVFKLYQERCKHGKEKSQYFHSLSTGFTFPLRNYLHSKSNNCVAKALENKKEWWKFLVFSALALALSPIHQTKFFFYRFKSKKLSI